MQRKLPLVTKSPHEDLCATGLQDFRKSILHYSLLTFFPTENHHSTEQHFQPKQKTGHASKQQETNLKSSE